MIFAFVSTRNQLVWLQVSDIDGLIGSVVACCGEWDTNPNLAFAALRLLHSLSRSVQELRTVFKDHNIWENVLAVSHWYFIELPSFFTAAFWHWLWFHHQESKWKELFQAVKKNENSQIMSIAAAILCNLSMEFSPNQQVIIASLIRSTLVLLKCLFLCSIWWKKD